MSETFAQAVERLKNNWLPWCRLSKKDREIMTKARRNTQRLNREGIWLGHDPDMEIFNNDVMRISPDYHPEPEKLKDIEVEIIDGVLGVVFPDGTNKYIDLLPRMPDFRGFRDVLNLDIPIYCDDVAFRKAEGKTIIARFEGK